MHTVIRTLRRAGLVAGWALAAAALSPSPGVAQSSDAEADAFARADAFDEFSALLDYAKAYGIDGYPWAVVSRQSAQSGVWSILIVDTDEPRSDPEDVRIESPHWRMQLVWGSPGATTMTASAASTDCPALIPTLQALQETPTPQVQMGVGRGAIDRMTMRADGEGVELWARLDFQNPYVAYDSILVRGGGDTPIAHWYEDALDALDPCWTNARPYHR